LQTKLFRGGPHEIIRLKKLPLASLRVGA
jgi:hypothetical protein